MIASRTPSAIASTEVNPDNVNTDVNAAASREPSPTVGSRSTISPPRIDGTFVSYTETRRIRLDCALSEVYSISITVDDTSILQREGTEHKVTTKGTEWTV